MQEIERKISNEFYERLIRLEKSEQEEKLFPEGIPIQWACGYGYYGHRLAVRGDQCYAIFTIGDSCD